MIFQVDKGIEDCFVDMYCSAMGNIESSVLSNAASSPLDIPEGNGLLFAGISLPHEILRYILSYVPASDLIVSATRVCKYWNDLLSDTHFWLYKLQVDGIDIPEAARVELTQDASFSKGLVILRMICSGHLPLGKNLIKNPSGAESFSHWSVVHGGDGLIVESLPAGSDPIPEEAKLPTQHCFVSSYGLCSRRQVIHLPSLRITPVVLKKLKPKFIISEWVSSRWDCRSESRLTVDFIGRKSTKTINLGWSSDDDDVVQRHWYEVKKTVTDYPADLYKIEYTNVSKDRQFWAGHYGAKTAGSSVKLLL